MLRALFRSIRGVKSGRRLVATANEYLLVSKARRAEEQDWTLKIAFSTPALFSPWFEHFCDCADQLSQFDTPAQQMLAVRAKCLDALQGAQFSRIFASDDWSQAERDAVARDVLKRPWDEQLAREQTLLFVHEDLSARCLRYISGVEFKDFRPHDWFDFYSDVYANLMERIVKNAAGEIGSQLLAVGWRQIAKQTRASILSGANYTEEDRAKLRADG